MVVNKIKGATWLPERTDMEFYPDIAYNKAKRRKFFILFAITMVCMLGLLSIMIVNDPKSLTVFLFMFVILVLLILLPSVLKSYPVNGKPIIEIGDKQIIYHGKYVVELKDIVGFKCNVLHPCTSRIPAEMIDELTEVGNHLTEEIRFGDVDLIIKGEKKNETLYATVIDCVGAAQALVDFGVKDYTLYVYYKKQVIDPKYKFTRTLKDDEKIDKLSKKERIKQLL